MKKSIIFLSFLILLCSCGEQEFFLTKNGKAKSVIVLPQQPTEVEQKAASILQDYVQQISGAELKIVSDNKKTRGNQIQIGKVNRPSIKNINFDELEKDGFLIRTNDRCLNIVGGTEKGTLYGVYSFLENYLGCRKYSSTASFVPKQETIILDSINDIQVPWFKFREVYYKDVFDTEYMDWHKLDSHGEINGESQWGFWCHSFNTLVSPDEYKESHPEYYSMIKGKRKPGSQLCLTNPDVLEITIKNLKTEIKNKPEPFYWSVSQNDNAEYCRCPECAKLNEQEGGPMGSILPFINNLAKSFPDKNISTLAYWYSTKPPKNVEPAENVNIMLCNIGSPRHIPIQEGDTTFCKDLEGWGRLTDNIILWDYVIQFANLVAPFPNLRTLQPNVQYLRDNMVTAMFEQGNRDVGGEFSELRAYLLSKLLWNPDVDIQDVMNDFLTGYYGEGGKFVEEYIDLIHNQLESTKTPLSIFGKPADAKETFLSDSLITVYSQIFDRAEEAVSDNPEFLERVISARLPILYSILEIAKSERTGGRGAFNSNGDGTLIPKREIIEILNSFTSHCNKTGVSRITEWHTTPDEYFEKYNQFLEKI